MLGGACEFRHACVLLGIGHLPVLSTLIEMEGGPVIRRPHFILGGWPAVKREAEEDWGR
jgi:hypothetical protein